MVDVVVVVVGVVVFVVGVVVVVVGVVVDGGEGVRDQGSTGCFSELYEKVTLVIYTA